MFYKLSRALKNRKGFTLVELMAVVVIIGILAAIAVPVYKNVQDKAAEKANLANIRIIEGALQMLLAEHPDVNQSDVDADKTGKITAPTSIANTMLAPTYLKEWPKQPTDSTKSYTIVDGVVTPES